MPYVIRDNSGKITRAAVKSIHGSEIVSYDDPDLAIFLESNGCDAKAFNETFMELRRTDIDMSRIIEDVVRALLKKNILKMTDLPEAVQDKISYRMKMRFIIEDALEQASQKSQKNEFNASGIDNNY